MKGNILLLMVSLTVIYSSCSSINPHQSDTARSHPNKVLSEAVVREIALACTKAEGKDADRYKIERVDVITVKGRIRWIVLFSPKENHVVDSEFCVDVDDETSRPFVRSHFGINPDDI